MLLLVHAVFHLLVVYNYRKWAIFIYTVLVGDGLGKIEVERS